MKKIILSILLILFVSTACVGGGLFLSGCDNSSYSETNGVENSDNSQTDESLGDDNNQESGEGNQESEDEKPDDNMDSLSTDFTYYIYAQFKTSSTAFTTSSENLSSSYPQSVFTIDWRTESNGDADWGPATIYTNTSFRLEGTLNDHVVVDCSYFYYYAWHLLNYNRMIKISTKNSLGDYTFVGYSTSSSFSNSSYTSSNATSTLWVYNSTYSTSMPSSSSVGSTGSLNLYLKYRRNYDINYYLWQSPGTYRSTASYTSTYLAGNSTTLRSTITNYSGYKFIGWATSSGAVSPTYAPGATLSTSSANKDYNFYAVYAPYINVYSYYTTNLSTFSNGSTGGSISVAYTNESGTSTTATVTTSGQYAVRRATTVSLTATHNSNYIFYGWYSSTPTSSNYTNRLSSSATTSFTASTSAPYNRYALFVRSYTLTINYTSAQVSQSTGLNVSSNNGTLSSTLLSTTTNSTTLRQSIASTGKTTVHTVTISKSNSSSSANYFIGTSSSATTVNTFTYNWTPTANATINIYVVQRYVITYNKNNSSATGTMSNTIKRYGTSVTLTSNAYNYTGHTFVNWTTSANGSGTSYANRASYTANADVTLYAQWTESVYTITLNKANGTGGTSTIYLKYSVGWFSNLSATTALNQINIPVRTGYTFLGYYTGTNGSGTQIIDANGNLFKTSSILTFTTTNCSIYANWEVSVLAKEDEDGNWYIEMGKMPQTRVTDNTIISALNGDSPFDDNDGVTTSPETYFFAGSMYSAKIYNNEEYCNFRGNWYLVEPIRWRLQENSNNNSGYANANDTFAVMESVVYVDSYSLTSIGINQGYVTVNSGSYSPHNYFLNNFLPKEKNNLVNFSATSQRFSSTGVTTESSSNTIFLSSEEEINSIYNGFNTEFSDLVEDYLNAYGDGKYYFVRDLGSNLNNVSCHTESGAKVNMKPTYMLGMRFTIKINEYVCE